MYNSYMRNINLVDAVLQLHEIANKIQKEVGDDLGVDIIAQIRNAAEELHKYSILDDKANMITQSIIGEVKK